MHHKKEDEVKMPKKARVRGKNFGHHSGLHGDARKARTAANKQRRAVARAKWLTKRREKKGTP